MSKRLADFSGVEDLTPFSADDLRAAIEDGYAILDPILDTDAPSADDIKTARETHAEIKRLEARLSEVEAEDAKIETEMAEMRAAREARAAAPEVEAEEQKPETDESGDEVTDDAEVTDTTESDQPEEVTAEVTTTDEEPEGDSVVVAEIDGQTGEVTEVEPERELVTASATTATPRTAGRRPVAPPKENKVDKVLIRAAHDTGVYASGQTLDSMLDVAKVAQARFAATRGMSGKSSPLGVASFQKPMPENMIVNEGMSDEVMAEVIDYVADETRLEGGSLVAANAGWCAPLETIWDICEGGTTEGLWDIPEMRVNRGGVRHMPASDFSALYAANTTPGTTAAGWYYTEAQVQADTAKVCIEVPCPTWDEIVLDAAGICVTSSLLTGVAHPEWVRAFVSEAMIAHQVLVQKKLLADAVSGATAFAATDMHSTTGSTLAAIELIVSNLRQTHRWSMSTSLEAVFPHWVKGAIRADLSMRNGVDLLAVTDAQITAWFALRGVRAQFVYGLNDLPAGAVVYPATFTALFYKAGTFVKGTTPVINLSTLYDSSLLSVNKAQQLFFEEGVLMLERCYGATAATIPVNNSGASAGQLVEALTAQDLTA